MNNEPLTDAQRFPLLNDAGRRMLRRLRQHPHGPRFNYPCGERLDAAGLANVRDYASQLKTQRVGWRFGEVPVWLNQFVTQCRRDVPFYRDQVDWPDDFFLLPTTTRDDLRREPWSFVPDSADLSQLIVYATSGTTGNLLQIISHPVAPNRYLPLMQSALAAYGITIEGGSERVSIIHVAAQRATYTIASAMSYFDFAGFAKVNLNPSEWNSPDDRARFLDDTAPEIYTGDPFAFAELAKLPLQSRPKALISSATTLLPAEQQQLESHFGCPVIDMYALNEAGPVSFSIDGEHEILPHNLYVEILDPRGTAVAPGELGEIVVTGGVNPNLPLIRYRTGDHAAVDFTRSIPRLVQFQGRQPVLFCTPTGTTVNSIEVTVALFRIPLPFLSLHQKVDGRLEFRTRCDATTQQAVVDTLSDLFGSDAVVEVKQLPLDEAWNGKWIQYSSDLSPRTDSSR
jgi:phenylacetate-CoA ligase